MLAEATLVTRERVELLVVARAVERAPGRAARRASPARGAGALATGQAHTLRCRCTQTRQYRWPQSVPPQPESHPHWPWMQTPRPEHSCIASQARAPRFVVYCVWLLAMFTFPINSGCISGRMSGSRGGNGGGGDGGGFEYGGGRMSGSRGGDGGGGAGGGFEQILATFKML